MQAVFADKPKNYYVFGKLALIHTKVVDPAIIGQNKKLFNLVEMVLRLSFENAYHVVLVLKTHRVQIGSLLRAFEDQRRNAEVMGHLVDY
jgi:hypothetical protein